MQKKLSLFTAVAAVLFGASAPRTHAAMSVDFFYETLDPYGDWVEVGDYGYCFQPRDTPEDWRPYSDGSWAYTDAGWTWVSDEPYGWATYHYGRWVDVESTGWVWVPDTEWAPAWVSWRHSDKYVGWAPLPPEATFSVKVGISSWADSYYDIGPTNYNFVQVRDLGAPRLNTVIVRRQENVTIINETRNITNITYVNNTVNNNGPQYDVISRQSAQPIRRLRLERRNEAANGGNGNDRYATRVSGDSLQIMAPPMQAGGGGGAPKRLRAKVENAQVDRGWKNAGSPDQVQALQAKVKSEAKAPEGLPPQPPKFQRAAARRADAPDASAPATADAATPTPAAPGDAPNAKPNMKDRKQPAVAADAPNATTPDQSAAPQPGGKKGQKARREAAADPASAPDPSAMPDASAEPGAKRGPKAGGKKMRPGQPAAAEAPATSTPDSAAPDAAETPDATPPQPNRPGKNRRPAPPDRPAVSAPADTAPAATPDAAAPADPPNPRPRAGGADRPDRPARADRPAQDPTGRPGAGPNGGGGGGRHNADSGAPRPNAAGPAAKPGKPEGSGKGKKDKKEDEAQ